MSNEQLQEKIDHVRKFNRFYTKRIGLLTKGLLKTRFPLTHARIIFELARHKQTSASDLIRELEIDPAYLSRILSSLEKDDLLQKIPSKTDGRKQQLKLTARGRKSFSLLNERASQEVKFMLQSLSKDAQDQLLDAMDTIENILGAEQKPMLSSHLRSHRPMDIGWMIQRHGILYAEEYDWDESFETLVTEILAKFVQNHDPEKERIWIAERDGERIGSVMIVDAGDHVAQLRLLLVEPKFRGKGIGKRLIDECIEFSKGKGYKKIILWTQSVLKEARHLYSKAGFKLVEKKPHTSFGHDLVGEIWELSLKGESKSK
jgi:DNA-binding MarR family transcriptional regulator/GNAT superfamily N-acetyltransferase